MASSKEYLEFILEQLHELEDITYRAMMGEYIIYYRGRIAAYICDNRFLAKPVPAAQAMLPNAPYEAPYEGAKDMILVEEADDSEFMCSLIDAMYEELPLPKEKKPKKK